MTAGGLELAPPPDCFERTYGVRRAWLTGLDVVAVVLVLASLLFMSLPSTRSTAYDLLTDETGPVELSTFAAFLLASLFSARLASQARRRGDTPPVPLVYACFAAFCAFAAMEEISWGQSLFDFRTPDWLWQINDQGETNIHDLVGIMDWNSAAVLAFALAGLAGVWLGAIPRFRDVAAPRALAPLLTVVAAMAALETYDDFSSVPRLFARIVGATSEAVELLGATACLAYVWLNGRMIRRRWAEDAGEPESALESELEAVIPLRRALP